MYKVVSDTVFDACYMYWSVVTSYFRVPFYKQPAFNFFPIIGYAGRRFKNFQLLLSCFNVNYIRY